MTTRRALARRSACVTCAAVLMMLRSPEASDGVLAPFRYGAAHDGHRAAANERHDVGDLRRALQKPIDVLAAADELDRVMLVRIAQDASSELLDDGLELRPCSVLGVQLEQRELALDVIGLRHVGEIDDVDELAELLFD